MALIITSEHVDLLLQNGWSVRTSGTLEVRHRHGSWAVGLAAEIVIESIIGKDQRDREAAEVESMRWRIAPGCHTVSVPGHPLSKKPDPFEGPGETWEGAYYRLLNHLDAKVPRYESTFEKHGIWWNRISTNVELDPKKLYYFLRENDTKKSCRMATAPSDKMISTSIGWADPEQVKLAERDSSRTIF